MAATGTDPSIGINADTGGTITGWDHVCQSLADIFRTNFGSRWMREWFGSFVPVALGRNINRQELLPVIASITSAIDMWEPRFSIVDVNIGGEIRDGRMTIDIRGLYRPRALLGDLTEDGQRQITLSLLRDTISIQ